MTLPEIYQRLLDTYGPQGWWPLLGHAGTNPTKTGAVRGYHPGDYSFPRNRREQFEICVGAVLTQNTAWPNVEKALRRLLALDALHPAAVIEMPEMQLVEAVRPSGYYHAKARKLRLLAGFFADLGGRTPSRTELLAVWGVGPETADSILLYAYRQPEMVVDAYTRRVLSHLGCVPPEGSYETLKAFCAAALPPAVEVRQEFHALMVEHAKHHYKRRPYHDPVLAEVCP